MVQRRLWQGLVILMVVSFSILGYWGYEIYQQAPPIPAQVVTTDGQQLFTREDIQEGQRVWASLGGMECGSIWGHGAYVAPDWSADWIHREALVLLDQWAQTYGAPSYEQADAPLQAWLRAELTRLVRPNNYDSATETITLTPERGAAVRAVQAYYRALFGGDPSLNETRAHYAMANNMVKDPQRLEQLTAFIWWSAWACVTERPGKAITYTSNWPHDEKVGNQPTAPVVVWSVLSLLMLLGGIGAMVYIIAWRPEDEPLAPPKSDPLKGLQLTPSMRATLKYFWLVAAIMLAQVGLGVVTAHYGVEGQGFYGIPLAEFVPYILSRTWHIQLGIFWIATAWLGTGLFLAPLVGGHEPKGQKLGVDILFVCLLVIVVGSFVGQWLSVMQRLNLDTSFWFGHQGYEYIDLGRFWQAFLFAGLFIWLGLMMRAMAPALREHSERRPMLILFALACLAIAGFYGAGLAWGQRTNLAIVEYWRWWVVHLWVEGFFEVFATVAVSFLFASLGLVRMSTAFTASMATTIVYLLGGILGTMHHLYFAGAPIGVLAWGSMFSALEVIPLVLIGHEALENLGMMRAASWMEGYRWPVYFFLGVAFWNLVGAGLFGFLINPPIALYYMQGLNTTPVHGHGALFGVYGLLAIGLMLFVLRAMTPNRRWRTRPLVICFWWINIGLLLMIVLSLLPVGVMQTWASVEHGYWYARSAEFMQTKIMHNLRWMRAIGDTIFAIGTVALGWFVVGLKFGWSLEPDSDEPAAIDIEPIVPTDE